MTKHILTIEEMLENLNKLNITFNYLNVNEVKEYLEINTNLTADMPNSRRTSTTPMPRSSM